MNPQLNYVFKLTLQDIALRRLVINICSGPTILTAIEKFEIKSIKNDFEKEWCKISEDQISGIISKLWSPRLVKRQILEILKTIGLQIVRWKVFHEKYLTGFSEKLGVPILSKLCWTYTGIVDYRKTAEALMQSKILDDVKLYKLACLYCLEDYIPVFWEKLPEEIKIKFYDEEVNSNIVLTQLQFCWPYILKGKESVLNCLSRKKYRELLSFNQAAFEYSSRRANKAAAEYFFRKLTREERDASLRKVVGEVLSARFSQWWIFPDDFPPENLSEVFFNLLSKMNNEQQMLIFKEYPAQVLCCFLEWPWKDVFLVNGDRIWEILSENSYNKLLSFMSDYLVACEMGDRLCFPKLFQELFVSSPDDFKKHFVNLESRTCQYFFTFFNHGETETMKVIFREIDYTAKFKLLSSPVFLERYVMLTLSDELYKLKACFEEAMLTEEDMLRLENAFMNYVMHDEYYKIEVISDRLKVQFFQFLREIGASAEGKRNSEDKSQMEARKLHKKCQEIV